MGLLEIELARTLCKERLTAADARRKNKDRQRMAREQQEEAQGSDNRRSWPKVEWPVFSIRVGGYELVAFRSVKLGP